jgi:hypothetical protein
MEAICPSETSVDFEGTTGHYIVEDRIFFTIIVYVRSEKYFIILNVAIHRLKINVNCHDNNIIYPIQGKKIKMK